MKTKFYIFSLVMMLAASATAQSPSQPESDESMCLKIIGAHGLMSRAQFQCGFTKYSSEFLDEARSCSDSLTQEQSMQALKNGMLAFDKSEADLGHAKACETIIQKYGRFVQP
jgi:hypothetical protein